MKRKVYDGNFASYNHGFKTHAYLIMRRKYVNIPLPEELTKEIEKIIKKGKLGYKTKSEFVKEAVRGKLIRLNKLKLGYCP